MLDRLRRLLARRPPESGPLPPVTLAPIGVVRNRIKEPMMYGWERVDSRIILRPELGDALDGLEGWSHLTVLFWMHAVPDDRRSGTTHIHPLGDPEYPLQGIFATRSQFRPNPIGATAVALLSRKGNVLRVRGLDAIDGTPVLDIKPYAAHYDSIADARIPAWAESIVERFRQHR
ncbi:MAG: tRNA (N6-threonylcarbamoyladenosine(37)-N6)-methyltransferase TrmO [Dehalococcoidia bacterium]